MFHMVVERGDGPRRERSRGDRGREGRGVDRNREDRERSRDGDRDDKTKGDDYRHLAESATRDAKYKAAKDACVAYVEASKMQIIEHVVEVPQIQYQEVVRHVTVPQVVTQEVVRQVPVPQPLVQMVKQPYPVPQVMNSEKVFGSDRSSIPSFLSGGTSDGGRYGPQSGEIVGILKQLIDEASVDLQTLEKEELDQKTNHRSLVKAKTRETLAVKVEKMESELLKAKRAPFVKVKGLVTRLINRLQTEMSHMSYYDEETSMASEKEDLDADTAKHSSTLVSRSTTLDGEISTLQSELSALSNRQLQTDSMRADFAIDHETVARGVVSNIRFDSFIDAEAQVATHSFERETDLDFYTRPVLETSGDECVPLKNVTDLFEADQGISVVHQKQTRTLQADNQEAVARQQQKHNNEQQPTRQVMQEKS